MQNVTQNNRQWFDGFDSRQRQEIEFSQVYAEEFAHGTDGHNAKMIIAKMARELNDAYQMLDDSGKALDAANKELKELKQSAVNDAVAKAAPFAVREKTKAKNKRNVRDAK